MSVTEFIPECNADTALLLALGIQRRHIAKADNNSKVAKALQAKGKNYHAVLIGLTDFDKQNVPHYFDEFEEINSENHVFHKQKPNTNQHIILIKPAVEKWLLQQASSVGVKISNYGFPEDLRELKKITTHDSIQRDRKFEAFIRDMKDRNAPGILSLLKIIVSHYTPPQQFSI